MKTFRIQNVPRQHQSLFLTGALLFALFTTQAFAGYVEVSLSGNYRKSVVTDKNYNEIQSTIASVSYYFWQQSALELSYTKGSYLTVTNFDSVESKLLSEFQSVGLDLVMSLAGKESVIQPYLKAGGAYLEKNIDQEVVGQSLKSVGSTEGISASAGIGMKIKLSKHFSLKIGADAWTSPLNTDPVTYDYAGRAGLSYMF